MTKRQLLIRADDAGLNHDTNRGIDAVLRAGVARSVGLMPCAPCFEDAVRRLRALPVPVSVGVHLTLNAEWTGYRWGPLLPAAEVPTLVDEDGFFPRNHRLYQERPPRVDHLVAELRAQIAAVRATGLPLCYADEHMVFTAASPWMADPVREIVGQACLLYDRDLRLDRAPSEAKSMEALVSGLRFATATRMLLVTHPAEDGPQMRPLQLGPVAGEPARSRAAELATLTDPQLPALISNLGVEPIGYMNLR